MHYSAPRALCTGGHEAPHADWGLVVEEGRIAAVGPVAEVAPRGVEPIRLAGTLLPGFIDCHTHIALSGRANPLADLRNESLSRRTLRAVAALKAHRRAGVTTIRDLGAPGGLDLELARGVAEGWVEGPRMMCAGKLVAITGGHACFLGIEADGADAVRKAVRSQLKAGAHLIKVIATGGVITEGVEPGAAQMTYEEMKAACEEAHKAGRRVAAHAQGTQVIRDALRAGVDTIEHAFFLDEETIGLMVQGGRVMVATFAAADAMLAGVEAGVPKYMVDKVLAIAGPHDRSFRAALAAGVTLACGTDAGTPLNAHGSIAVEMEAFVARGASPVQALHGATGAAAVALGREDIGRLEVGRRADLVEIAGDPLQSISAVRAVSGVWVDGRPVSDRPS